MSPKKKNNQPTSRPKADADQKIELMKKFIRTHGKDFLKDQNISSVGIGYKIKDQQPSKELSFQFTVEEKVRTDLLESLSTKEIPKKFILNGVEIPTDVIQRKYTHDYKIVQESAENDRKIHADPIVAGISVANEKESAGTIGCIVYDKYNGMPYILSNWHVLQGPRGKIGDEVVQPGPYDDNRTGINRLGKLIRSYLGIAGDCAIATIENRLFREDILELGAKIEQLAEPELGDKVIKSSRTSGVTHGIVTRIHTIVKLDYGGSAGTQEIGCFEIGLDPDQMPLNGEISEGGDSGSAWIIKDNKGKPTKIMAGLHFAGEGSGDPKEHAMACYAKPVFEKLQITLTSKKQIVPGPDLGYNSHFLHQEVDLPKIKSPRSRKALVLQKSSVIHYTHFSLSLNKERRFAFWVAWNIDGSSLKKVSRTGLKFIYDPRIPEKYQAGDFLYSGNLLDRGHIARRADLVWGTLDEAKKANKDSFYFTNIIPQMNDFNQSKLGGIWGKLEDAIFDEVDVDDLKVSVFGGPIFRDDDRKYREIKIPREFYKILVYMANGTLQAKAFLLTQNLNELELLDLKEFKVYQVTVSEIEKRTGLSFPEILKVDKKVELKSSTNNPEVEIAGRNYLNSLTEVKW